MHIPLTARESRDAPPEGTRLALAQKGFRPFFLLAAAQGALAVPLWWALFSGWSGIEWPFPAQTWHAHEMVFGYAVAVIAGFLLTAVANWTGREVLVGPPLLALAASWVLGRIAFLAAGVAPQLLVAIVDAAFLPALTIVVARPLLKTRNSRNYVMIAVLLGLSAANGVTHLDLAGVTPGWGRRVTLASVYLIAVLMVLISARILPMFTRNATRAEGIQSSPRLDQLALAAAVAVLLCDFVWGDGMPTPVVSAAAALLIFARARHWGGRKALSQPMLWILHAGHAFIGVGFGLKALTPWLPALASSSFHALTVGAIGCLTLGMMARVSLGHTGRMIVADRATVGAFTAMVVAAVVRVGAPLIYPHYVGLIGISAGLWALALALFTWRFARILLSPRMDGAPG